MVDLIVGKNSYSSIAEVDAYLDESIRAATIWLAVAPDTKARAMISAYRQIEKQTFRGTATGVDIVGTFAVTAGGTGYAVGELLSGVDGAFGEPFLFEVVTVASGAVSTVKLLHAGTYTVAPSGAVATLSSIAGAGCTITPAFIDQVSDWVRAGMVDCDGVTLEADEYPNDLKSAQFELAFELTQNADLETASGTGSNIKSVGAGSAKVDFFRPSDDTQRFPTVVHELLGCFLASSAPFKMGLASGTNGVSTFADPCKYDLESGY